MLYVGYVQGVGAVFVNRSLTLMYTKQYGGYLGRGRRRWIWRRWTDPLSVLKAWRATHVIRRLEELGLIRRWRQTTSLRETLTKILHYLELVSYYIATVKHVIDWRGLDWLEEELARTYRELGRALDETKELLGVELDMPTRELLDLTDKMMSEVKSLLRISA